MLDILKNRIFIHQIICMKFSRYTAVITSFSSHRLLTVLSVIRNLNLLKSLIAGKTSFFIDPAATYLPIPLPV